MHGVEEIPAGQPEPSTSASAHESETVGLNDQEVEALFEEVLDTDKMEDQDPAATAATLDQETVQSGKSLESKIEEFGAAAVAAANQVWEGGLGGQTAMKDGVNARDSGFARGLQAAVASGEDIDARGAIAQRMMRELSTEQKAALTKA